MARPLVHFSKGSFIDLTLQEDQVVDLTSTYNHRSESSILPEIEDVEEIQSPILVNPQCVPVSLPSPVFHTQPVACHFFYPTIDIADENGSGEGATDPLALTPEWIDCTASQPGLVSVDDELMSLEDESVASVETYNVVDPLSIAEADRLNIKQEPEDVKPCPELLEKSKGKRRILDTEEAVNNVARKKLNIGAKEVWSNTSAYIKVEDVGSNNSSVVNIEPEPVSQPTRPQKRKPKPLYPVKKKKVQQKGKQLKDNTVPSIEEDNQQSFQELNGVTPSQEQEKVGLKVDYSHLVKQLKVCIGPKLPLPECFRRKTSCSAERPPSPIQSNVSAPEPEVTDQHSHEHIVLKIYTCSKCNHKCTDPLFHEAHVSLCMSENSRSFTRSLLQNDADNAKTKVNSVLGYSLASERTTKTGLFYCEICRYRFKNDLNLAIHLSKHSDKKFTCYICHLQFVSVDKLGAHYKLSHKTALFSHKFFSCNFCQYSTRHIDRLKKHMIVHNVDKNLFCYTCNTNFEDLKDFAAHRKRLHGKITVKNRNKIDESNKSKEDTFQRNIELTNKHNKNKGDNSTKKSQCLIKGNNKISKLKASFKNQVITDERGLYKCNGCMYKFSQLQHLSLHREEHLSKQPFKCCKCLFETLSVFDYGKHMKSHPGEASFKCNVCDVVCTSVEDLAEHTATHVYVNLYCDMCNFNMDTFPGYKKHMKHIHDIKFSSNFFSCSKCYFTTKCSKTYKTHKAKHLHAERQVNFVNSEDTVLGNSCTVMKKDNTMDNSLRGNKVLKCCNKMFADSITFKRHRFKMHGKKSEHLKKTTQANKNKKVLKCNKCDFFCFTINSFLSHYQIHKHSNLQNIKCGLCDSRYTRIANYRQHMESHGTEAVFLCCYCPFSSNKVNDFKKHMLKHFFKQCPLCNFKTQRMKVLEDHLKMHKRHLNKQCATDSTTNSSSSKNILSNSESLNQKASNIIPKIHLKESLKRPQKRWFYCTLCPYRTFRAFDLKRHMIKHSQNRNYRVRAFGFKRPTKKKIQSNETKLEKVKNMGVYYRCSQCEYKKKSSKSVSQHLLSLHNIVGGIRNNMVIKVLEPLPVGGEPAEKQLNNPCGKSKLVKSQISRKSGPFSNTAVRPTKKVNKSVELTKSIIKKSYANKFKISSKQEKCKKCNIHTLSRTAQIDHKKIGHKAFWNKPFFCKICGTRYTVKASLLRHYESIHKENGSHLVCKKCNSYSTHRTDSLAKHLKRCNGNSGQHHESQVKTPTVLPSVDDSLSDDENYVCGECDFETTDIIKFTTHMFVHSGLPDD